MPKHLGLLTDLDEHELSLFARALYRILRVLGPLPLDYEIHQGEGLPLHAHINARLYPYSNVAGTLNIPSTLLHSAIAIQQGAPLGSQIIRRASSACAFRGTRADLPWHRCCGAPR